MLRSRLVLSYVSGPRKISPRFLVMRQLPDFKIIRGYFMLRVDPPHENLPFAAALKKLT